MVVTVSMCSDLCVAWDCAEVLTLSYRGSPLILSVSAVQIAVVLHWGDLHVVASMKLAQLPTWMWMFGHGYINCTRSGGIQWWWEPEAEFLLAQSLLFCSVYHHITMEVPWDSCRFLECHMIGIISLYRILILVDNRDQCPSSCFVSVLSVL